MKVYGSISLLFLIILISSSCASAYREIDPSGLGYRSGSISDSLAFQYKYDVLEGKYARNETRKGIKIVALKITNNSNRDLIFGKDVELVYENGMEVIIGTAEEGFYYLKQHPATYLWYLLLTPLNIYTVEYDRSGFQEHSKAFPIGLVVGPALSFGNMVVAATANRKFRSELRGMELVGTTIKKGETAFGLITIKSPSFDALELQFVF